MTAVTAPLTLRSGATMPNRFMLAPLTNLQSHADGTLSAEEEEWLAARSRGGFGAVMTAASHVTADGQGFPGQLGVFDDRHTERLAALASRLRADGAVALVQLHHAGKRSPVDLVPQPVSSSDTPDGARALTTDEVRAMRESFIAAAVRSQAAGFDGVELHGAHGYLLAQFISPTMNKRTDEYGGSLENRTRLMYEIIEGIHETCGGDFALGVRLSPERFGMRLDEVVQISADLLVDERIDFLDISLWDTFKEPHEPEHQGRPLADYFTELPRDGVALGFAGHLHTPTDVDRAMELGIDFVMLGKAAILQADFPNRYLDNPSFEPVSTPVTIEYLTEQYVSAPFLSYLNERWDDFVA